MMLYRGAFAVVDLTSIQSNIRNIRALLQPDTRLMVAVKANGYGHGATQVAHAVLSAGATDLAVASLEEALELRRAGVVAPILVLGVVPTVGALMAQQNRIDLAVSTDWNPLLEEGGDDGGLARLLGLDASFPPLRLHLKLDTGMGRIGFRDEASIVRWARRISESRHVTLAGLFTHLAMADVVESSSAEKQLDGIQSVERRLIAESLRPELIHAANSAGIFRRRDFHLDMVRVGISAYGYPPNAGVPAPVRLQPALGLYAFITRIAEIDVGETVGYGGTFVARRRTRVGTVPLGYADGVPRWLSNRGMVVVHGKRAPVIGRVCMDQLMIDLTDIPAAVAGDCVCLYGRYAPKAWTAAALWARLQVRPGQGLEPVARQDTTGPDATNDGAVPAGSVGDFAMPAGSAKVAEAWLTETYRRETSPDELLSLDEIAGIGDTISYELMCALSARIPRLYVSGD